MADEFDLHRICRWTRSRDWGFSRSGHGAVSVSPGRFSYSWRGKRRAILSGPHVVGINCSEWPANIDHPPGPGFGVQSRCLADAFLDDVILPGETAPRRVTFHELVAAGCIKVAGYVPREVALPLRGTLVRLDMPATARSPAVEVEIYA